ncbi:MAG: hypothetical protein HS103_00025 [Anaerolineales bacterium]|nr:hypothetical protein [Anaerolineales bacterium]
MVLALPGQSNADGLGFGQAQQPTCKVTVAEGRNPSYFTTPLEMLGRQLTTGSLPSGTIIEVDLRSFVNPNLVRIRTNATDPASVGRWFYAGGGNVTQTPQQQQDTPCNVLTTQVIDPLTALTELEQDYGVLLRNESTFVWTETEIVEIYKGVVTTAAALDRLSDSSRITPELFRQIMITGDTLPYIVLYKAVGTPNSQEIAVAYTVPSGTETKSVSFGNNVNDASDNITDGGCVTFQGTGATTAPSPIPRTIVCNSLSITAGSEMILAGASGQTNLAFMQYLLVHELGHVFDNRTTSTNCSPTSATSPCRLLNLAFQGLASGSCPAYLRDSLRADALSELPDGSPDLSFTTTCTSVEDADSFRVIGIRSDLGQYGRRDRGWGAGPDNIFTDFQQHPADVFASDPLVLVLEEEAADMFLNWVYRTISNIPFTYLDPLSVPGTWSGFRNQSWGTYGSNAYTGSDSTYPGDARLEWMQIIMQNIFDEKGW